MSSFEPHDFQQQNEDIYEELVATSSEQLLLHFPELEPVVSELLQELSCGERPSIVYRKLEEAHQVHLALCEEVQSITSSLLGDRLHLKMLDIKTSYLLNVALRQHLNACMATVSGITLIVGGKAYEESPTVGRVAFLLGGMGLMAAFNNKLKLEDN